MNCPHLTPPHIWCPDCDRESGDKAERDAARRSQWIRDNLAILIAGGLGAHTAGYWVENTEMVADELAKRGYL